MQPQNHIQHESLYLPGISMHNCSPEFFCPILVIQVTQIIQQLMIAASGCLVLGQRDRDFNWQLAHNLFAGNRFAV